MGGNGPTPRWAVCVGATLCAASWVESVYLPLDFTGVAHGDYRLGASNGH